MGVPTYQNRSPLNITNRRNSPLRNKSRSPPRITTAPVPESSRAAAALQDSYGPPPALGGPSGMDETFAKMRMNCQRIAKVLGLDENGVPAAPTTS